jgi:hypothetical protein
MISVFLVSSVCKLVDAYAFFSSTEILLGDCETKARKWQY